MRCAAGFTRNTSIMSKPSTAHASDIREVVMREDDFGHEMRVGHLIRSIVGMQWQHGGTYTDPVTQKPRQFDYRCFLNKESACLSLAIECKNLSSAVPLVICGTARRETEAFHDLIEARNGHFRKRSATIVGLSSVTRRATGKSAFYPADHFVGKSLVRIQTDRKPMARSQDGDVYDKWAQALSSAVGLAESACSFPNGATPPKLLVAILPIVVVPDTVMWSVSYDNDGNISSEPKQIEEGELFVGKQIELGQKKTPLFHVFTFSHVHFFSLTGFQSFLSEMVKEDGAWKRLFTDESIEL